MTLFVREAIYSVGIDEIGHQHQRLFTIADTRHDALTTCAKAGGPQAVLSELLAYTHYHFAAEERLVEHAGYPDLEHHRAGHAKLLATVLNRQRRFESGAPGADAAVMELLRMWLTAHILIADRDYAYGIESITAASLGNRSRRCPASCIHAVVPRGPRLRPGVEARAAGHDCKDAGGTTTGTWEVELRRERQPRATQGAVTEGWPDCGLAPCVAALREEPS